jgi:hypothetical protein
MRTASELASGCSGKLKSHADGSLTLVSPYGPGLIASWLTANQVGQLSAGKTGRRTIAASARN